MSISGASGILKLVKEKEVYDRLYNDNISKRMYHKTYELVLCTLFEQHFYRSFGFDAFIQLHIDTKLYKDYLTRFETMKIVHSTGPLLNFRVYVKYYVTDLGLHIPLKVYEKFIERNHMSVS